MTYVVVLACDLDLVIVRYIESFVAIGGGTYCMDR